MVNKWWRKIIGQEIPRQNNGYVPHWRDSFYRPEHGSGYVKDIDYPRKTVTVKYVDGTETLYEWYMLEGTFTNQYGGIWVPDY